MKAEEDYETNEIDERNEIFYFTRFIFVINRSLERRENMEAGQ